MKMRNEKMKLLVENKLLSSGMQMMHQLLQSHRTVVNAPIRMEMLVLTLLILHFPFLAPHSSFIVSTVCAQTVPIDYSYCGYHRSETPIPSAAVAAYVLPSGGDDAAAIQAAIDRVSLLKPDRQTGLRGAVLLGEGTFTISQPLRIRTSGVVLRGSHRDRTILRKTGYDRGAAIYIEGTREVTVLDTFALADAAPGALVVRAAGDVPATVVPVGAITKGGVASSAAARRLMILRPSTPEWIDALGCASFGGGKRMGYWAWHPGDIDLRWHRRVLAVNGRELTLDAPITCSLETRYGGAVAVVYEQPGMVRESGVENLTLESVCNPTLPMDESHCWDGVYLADAEDCWVRMVCFRHFAGSAVVAQKTVRQLTVEDCLSLQPVSELGGFRRRTFLTFGQQVLFQRCYSEYGINDFAVGHTAAGPNAFVQCESYESFGPSGAIASWAPGILFDIVNVDGNDIVFRNWELQKFGGGWSTANSTLWQSTAAALLCYSPDTLNRNYSIGCWGQIQGNGEFSEMNEHVRPYSLFAAQLLRRRLKAVGSADQGTSSTAGLAADSTAVARQVAEQCRVLERNTNASSSPTIEEAMQMAEEALQPRLTLRQWIDSARLMASVEPVATEKQKNKGKTVPVASPAHVSNPESADQEGHRPAIALTNGWLTRDGAVLVGGKHQTPWWNGRTTDATMAKAKMAVTRFVPGYEGRGGTDRIDSVVSEMQRTHTLLFSQNYGLWTDRRRDDHERIRRKDGDAWAPFYEQPFARVGYELPTQAPPSAPEGATLALGVELIPIVAPSGAEGGAMSALAWDGLSRYDLTKQNRWYFWRLQQFARKGEQAGLLLKNQHYFQHNILEAGAHWVDCPWRTANNVNHTPFSEPVNFTGDKRIFVATQFYDTANPTLRTLHRQYIRQQLDAFKGQPNVIHSIGEEFTGPLHFVQFWLDVIAEWERENGRVLVALAVNKDVQDAILNDPVRSQVVDIIDIEQWFYHSKGEYAPLGGVNMAQRQYLRKIRTGSARFEDVYRAVSEYRLRYPGKAVVYSAQKHPEMCWASLMAGGSCAAIPVTDEAFLRSLAQLTPSVADGAYLLTGATGGLCYKDDDRPTVITLSDQSAYMLYRVDAASGRLSKLRTVKGKVSLTEKGIYWYSKK